MYLAGYIEKVGTGTRDIYRFCKEAGLKEPEFHFDGDFRITIWRKDKSEGLTGQVEAHDKAHDKAHDLIINDTEREILRYCAEPKSTPDILVMLGYKTRAGAYKKMMIKLIEAELIVMTIPESPRSKNQKYRLTEKGKKIIGNEND